MLRLLTKGNLIRCQIVLMSGDVLIALGIFLFAHNFLPYPLCTSGGLVLIVAALLMITYMSGRYQTATHLKALCYSVFLILISVSLYMICSVVKAGEHTSLPYNCLILFFLMQTWWHCLVHKLYKSVLLKQKIIVLGTGPIAEKVARMIQADSDHYSLLGFIGTPKDYVTISKDKIIGEIEDIVKIATARLDKAPQKADSIVLALTEKRGNPFMDQLISCKLNGIRIIEYFILRDDDGENSD